MAAAQLNDYAAVAAAHYEKLESGGDFSFRPVTALWSIVCFVAAVIVQIDGEACERGEAASPDVLTFARQMRAAAMTYLAERTQDSSDAAKEQWAYRFGFLSGPAVDIVSRCKIEASPELGRIADLLWKSDARVLCDASADCMRMAILADIVMRLMIWKLPAATYEMVRFDSSTAFRRSEHVDA